ncbi:hypothetical protein ASG04_12110 [Curtobacterium sp. Leaf183]|uniref:universal stress protein n=1 Tax=Curtobacterium sp. Leaf183 TaxID=1736291 RepID=UPI0007011CD8|nr:universal stress protein [Curtobacterium sp. Leaf183]KQS07909.1 hypothetical protein ASG04_12110 [Curtobacterium sp. Leaf183]
MDEHWTTVTLAADAARPHDEALRWVVAHAATDLERLRVVDVDPTPEGRDGPPPDGRGGPPPEGRDDPPPEGRVGPGSRRVAEQVAEAARAALPDVEVDVVRHAGPLAAALVAESGGGDLLVVGTFRSRRGSTLGSAPARVAERAAVPTVVLPDGPDPIDGDVVLAVDEPEDERAVAIAVAEASRRHRRLTLLRAWEMPLVTRTGLTDFAEDPLRWRRESQALLQRATDRLVARAPGVRVRSLLVEGHPGPAIVAHTRTASLVVLGQGHVHVLSGSVLRDVLRRSVAPVCVVPATAHETPTRSRGRSRSTRSPEPEADPVGTA